MYKHKCTCIIDYTNTSQYHAGIYTECTNMYTVHVTVIGLAAHSSYELEESRLCTHHEATPTSTYVD